MGLFDWISGRSRSAAKDPAVNAGPAGLPAALIPYERPTWVPETDDAVCAARGSRFGGAATLKPGEAWPCCRRCGQPMNLLLQLGSRDLPEGVEVPWGDGLLQAWGCTSSEPQLCLADGGWEAFDGSQLVRTLGYDQVADEATPSAAREPWPARHITGWTVQEDLPGYEDQHLLGIDLTDEQHDRLDALELPRSGDKLMGWPAWVQGAEYPSCPDCGESMTAVFQIDSEDHVPWMWGDSGCGHLSVCPSHPERAAWAWACC